MKKFQKEVIGLGMIVGFIVIVILAVFFLHKHKVIKASGNHTEGPKPSGVGDGNERLSYNIVGVTAPVWYSRAAWIAVPSDYKQFSPTRAGNLYMVSGHMYVFFETPGVLETTVNGKTKTKQEPGIKGTDCGISRLVVGDTVNFTGLTTDATTPNVRVGGAGPLNVKAPDGLFTGGFGDDTCMSEGTNWGRLSGSVGVTGETYNGFNKKFQDISSLNRVLTIANGEITSSNDAADGTDVKKLNSQLLNVAYDQTLRPELGPYEDWKSGAGKVKGGAHLLATGEGDVTQAMPLYGREDSTTAFTGLKRGCSDVIMNFRESNKDSNRSWENYFRVPITVNEIMSIGGTWNQYAGKGVCATTVFNVAPGGKIYTEQKPIGSWVSPPPSPPPSPSPAPNN